MALAKMGVGVQRAPGLQRHRLERTWRVGHMLRAAVASRAAVGVLVTPSAEQAGQAGKRCPDLRRKLELIVGAERARAGG
jgi:hypothetical protein